MCVDKRQCRNCEVERTTPDTVLQIRVPVTRADATILHRHHPHTDISGHKRQAVVCSLSGGTDPAASAGWLARIGTTCTFKVESCPIGLFQGGRRVELWRVPRRA